MDADPDFASLKAPPASIFTQRAHAAKSYWISRRFCRGCTFNDANAAERRETQYFEMAGNRGIYHKGWTAVTRHRTPWETGRVQLPAFDDDVWQVVLHHHGLEPVEGSGKGEPRKAAPPAILALLSAFCGALRGGSLRHSVMSAERPSKPPNTTAKAPVRFYNGSLLPPSWAIFAVRGDQPPDVMIGVLKQAGVNFHLADEGPDLSVC